MPILIWIGALVLTPHYIGNAFDVGYGGGFWIIVLTAFCVFTAAFFVSVGLQRLLTQGRGLAQERVEPTTTAPIDAQPFLPAYETPIEFARESEFAKSHRAIVGDLQFDFEMRWLGEFYRLYILSNTDYQGAPDDAHTSHRLFCSDRNLQFICLANNNMASTEDGARDMADFWASYTEFLIRTKRAPRDDEIQAAAEPEALAA